MGSREEPGPIYTEDGFGSRGTSTHSPQYHFNQIQYGGIIQTSQGTPADALNRVEPKEIKMHLSFRMKSPSGMEKQEYGGFVNLRLIRILQNIANDLPTGRKMTAGKAYKLHDKMRLVSTISRSLDIVIPVVPRGRERVIKRDGVVICCRGR